MKSFLRMVQMVGLQFESRWVERDLSVAVTTILSDSVAGLPPQLSRNGGDQSFSGLDH